MDVTGIGGGASTRESVLTGAQVADARAADAVMEKDQGEKSAHGGGCPLRIDGAKRGKMQEEGSWHVGLTCHARSGTDHLLRRSPRQSAIVSRLAKTFRSAAFLERRGQFHEGVGVEPVEPGTKRQGIRPPDMADLDPVAGIHRLRQPERPRQDVDAGRRSRRTP